ncbi:MAG TPA: 2-amino-4-hydroxy-6-hydroxymethyldihydropteridine diphosphokinase [Rectinemataceae bacterium]|nr:2-amino-4-hydroxy-6-hydroxymethyldihydropteridine diphosphokinase [Rectinemataceae bacterium]
METVWFGVGSNLGNSEALIGRAVSLLGKVVSGGRLSGLWRSKARYVEDQPDFLNAVFSGMTELEPHDVLKAIQRIERELGRDRSAVVPKGARTMDIDILLFGERIIADDDLVVPHPGMRERKFVLLPLLELDPGLLDPVSGRAFRDFLAELPPQGIYPAVDRIYDAAYP